MFRRIIHPASETGQGLVEYALILILVSLVAIGVLSLFGPQLTRVYCSIIHRLGGDPPQCEFIVVTRARCNPGHGELSLWATYGSGYNPSVTLTASPGGPMQGDSVEDRYRLNVNLGSCPSTVTITSSRGDQEVVDIP